MLAAYKIVSWEHIDNVLMQKQIHTSIIIFVTNFIFICVCVCVNACKYLQAGTSGFQKRMSALLEPELLNLEPPDGVSGDCTLVF